MNEKTLSEVKAEIVAQMKGSSYEQVGKARKINRGIIWKLLNQPDYRPTRATMRKLGALREKPRVRITAQVPEDWRDGAREAALAEGITVAEWLRRVIAEELFPEEHVSW